jgi:hypothetical protein
VGYQKVLGRSRPGGNQEEGQLPEGVGEESARRWRRVGYQKVLRRSRPGGNQEEGWRP